MSLTNLGPLLHYGDLFVLFVLFAMSLWAVQIVLHRIFVMRRLEADLRKEDSELVQQVSSNLQDLQVNTKEVFDLYYPGASDQIYQRITQGLPILGTMGNSAPFIGLFGTVLGIIKAFQDLATASKAGPQIVMAGISQALVATAMGLLVAIPAVIAFNYFSTRAASLKRSLRNRSLLLIAKSDPAA